MHHSPRNMMGSLQEDMERATSQLRQTVEARKRDEEIHRMQVHQLGRMLFTNMWTLIGVPTQVARAHERMAELERENKMLQVLELCRS